MTPSPAGRAALSVVGATAALGAATLAYSLIEARCPVLRRIDVPVLAADEEPLTVLHLSDLHLTDRTEARVAWVQRLAQLQPDVVVNTGDNLSLACGLEPLQRALEPLTGMPGAFVMGDHDYRTTVFRLPTRYLHRDPRKASSRVRDEDIEALPWEEVRDLQAAGGWANLTNRRDSLTVGGRRIELVGVDDPHANRDVFPVPGAGGDAASSGSADSALSLPAIRNREGRALRLGLTHAPYRRVLEAMSADDVDLVLAGHTHGGQLCVPGAGALVTNCDLDRGRASGLSQWPGRLGDPRAADHMYLHVSAGLGTSPYTPVRLACRPEAALLRLLPA